jgi:hypothetical protein
VLLNTSGGKSLKAQNSAWLWSVTMLDATLLLFATQQATHTTDRTIWLELRAALTAAAPVIVLLLTSLLPSDLKAVLVFWRWRDVLPSHRAFTLHATRDSRIDLTALRKNVGKLPAAPRNQSSRWYKLYKAVETDVIVSTAHRHFLLFRDLASMSFVLAFLGPLGLWFFAPQLTALAGALFTVQYAFTAIAARHHGTRMVTNVLALHSTKKGASTNESHNLRRRARRLRSSNL